jgi:hypothetical protein
MNPSPKFPVTTTDSRGPSAALSPAFKEQPPVNFKAGTGSYLPAITSQATPLSVTAVTLLIRRPTASGLLIEGLAGGWNASQLPAK